MSRIFITGSADGLGQLAAELLVKQGHNVVLHARNSDRAKQAMSKVPGAETVLTGDLSSMKETKNLAAAVNAMGRFDAVIHNAGVYQVPKRELTVDGLPLLFAVNSLAPYILTVLIQKPERLIYLSSGSHLHADPKLDGLSVENLRTKSPVDYSDTKFHDVLLAKAVARKWPEIYSNALDPGWVPTKMGGRGAPDNLEKGYQTQVWLAVSNDKAAKVSGRYFFHQKESRYLPAADDVSLQEKFLKVCEEVSGVFLG